MTEPNLELKTYHGNCHCGAFKFTIKMPELTSVTKCDCSICFKKGYRWVFPPSEDSFEIVKGEGTLKEYIWGQRTMVHRFCPTCGTGVQGFKFDAPEGRRTGFNANALQDVDQWSLETRKFGGLDLDPPYVVPKFTGTLPTAELENPKFYTGGCHCGAVTVALKNQGPLTEGHTYIQDCNCSICCRFGAIFCYPKKDQVSIDGASNLTTYSFGRGHNIFRFCSICGINVNIEKNLSAVKKEEWDSWSKEKQDTWPLISPLNITCLDGVEWDTIDVKRCDNRGMAPQYVVPE